VGEDSSSSNGVTHSDVETEEWALILADDLGASFSPGLLVGGVLLLLLLLWLLG
jgi:hypothetical protein